MAKKKQMISKHKLANARFLPSPNYNNRPNNSNISLIVIHNISLPPKQYGGSFVEDFFLNKLDYNSHSYFKNLKNIKVSSHIFIKRDGDIVQFVPFDKRAWHAGESNYNGIENCNDFSIGIELEGSDDIGYENKQYQQLNYIIQQLKENYPIIDIVSHSYIAPERKTDPGDAFDWQKIKC